MSETLNVTGEGLLTKDWTDGPNADPQPNLVYEVLDRQGYMHEVPFGVFDRVSPEYKRITERQE